MQVGWNPHLYLGIKFEVSSKSVSKADKVGLMSYLINEEINKRIARSSNTDLYHKVSKVFTRKYMSTTVTKLSPIIKDFNRSMSGIPKFVGNLAFEE